MVEHHMLMVSDIYKLHLDYIITHKAISITANPIEQYS